MFGFCLLGLVYGTVYSTDAETLGKANHSALLLCAMHFFNGVNCCYWDVYNFTLELKKLISFSHGLCSEVEEPSKPLIAIEAVIIPIDCLTFV